MKINSHTKHGIVSMANASTPASITAFNLGLCHFFIVSFDTTSAYVPVYSDPSCKCAPYGPIEPTIHGISINKNLINDLIPN